MNTTQMKDHEERNQPSLNQSSQRKPPDPDDVVEEGFLKTLKELVAERKTQKAKK